MIERKLIQRQFSDAAHQYDLKSSMQRDIVDSQLAAINGKPSSVVDLGCGTGYAIDKLTQLGIERIVGVDLAPSMLEVARQRNANASYLCADLEAVPLADCSVDLVLSASAFQWCDLARAAAEAIRVLRPKGQIVLSTFSHGTLAHWRDMWGFNDERRFVERDGLIRAVEQCGATVSAVSNVIFRQSFGSFNDAVSSIRDIGAGERPQTGLMGAKRYRQVRDKVNDIIAQRGHITLVYHVTTINAEKCASASNCRSGMTHSQQSQQKSYV
ncbi:methyltransferase domain-containing protein [Arenicella xantha]|uniref:Malonyl-CoA O-methyltransferase n=1 Tax=Arenicella xantha TaxID=644221 RepID=A0A395JNM1_9GAMM|nr:methyltransferase domain-containing protein [Arenicella xantha]RBP53087.1 malonyl-CoA O-methyltransferase [Arenicella xantha]